MPQAVLGISIVAHFGNNLRTFGYVAPSLQKERLGHRRPARPTLDHPIPDHDRPLNLGLGWDLYRLRARW